MKQQSQEKLKATSTIAWFKLAEVVSRGEKERALSMYRLLGHSIHNEALKLQLEGDLLRIFQDDQSLNSYSKAAGLFAQNGDWIQVALLHTLMIEIAPHVYEYRHGLIKAYANAGDFCRSAHAAYQFILHCCSIFDYSYALNIARETSADLAHKTSWFLTIARAAATSSRPQDIQIGKECIVELSALDFFIKEHQAYPSSQFLSFIQSINQELYHYAHENINLA